MKVLVVIAFRGSPDTLQWVLDGFAQQQLTNIELQIAVGGDGCDVPPPPNVPASIKIRTQKFDRIGAAAVRNGLIQNSDGDILIFGNADARPAPDMVQRHVDRLRSLPPHSAVLGSAPWEVLGPPTVLHALLAETPMIFFYPQMESGKSYDFRHVWTLNLSLHRTDFLAAGGLNEALRPVYYEDLALGFHLFGADQKEVYFDADIQVLHRHPTALDQYLDREELLGIMAPVLARHEPALFATLFAGRSLTALQQDYQTWVTLDAPMHRWIYQRLQEWADLPAATLSATPLPTGDARQRLLLSLYQMHIPLKRLAFRLGFLHGLTIPDDHWQDRRPTSLWRKIIEHQ